jgi:uncharacterized membrane protein YhfC
MDMAVVLAFIIVSLGQILIPLGLGYWAKRRFNVSWKVFGLGAMFFIAVQIVHTPLVLLTQTGLASYLQGFLGQLAVMAVIAVYLGVLAGIFEEPARYIVFRHVFPRRKVKLNKKNALMFGLGWGGIESVFVAAVLLMTMFSYMTAVPLTDQDIQSMNDEYYGGMLTQQQLDAMKVQNDALLNLAPTDLVPSLLERMMSIAVHVGFTMMIFSAVVFRRKLLLLLAVIWHAALDFLAVFTAFLYGLWTAESIVLAFALMALVYTRHVWKKTNIPNP